MNMQNPKLSHFFFLAGSGLFLFLLLIERLFLLSSTLLIRYIFAEVAGFLSFLLFILGSITIIRQKHLSMRGLGDIEGKNAVILGYIYLISCAVVAAILVVLVFYMVINPRIFFAEFK
jgi:hypothetical protein